MNTKTVHGRLRPGRRFLTRPNGVICEQVGEDSKADVRSVRSFSRLSLTPRQSVGPIFPAKPILYFAITKLFLSPLYKNQIEPIKDAGFN
jgi:hypothetical protein